MVLKGLVPTQEEVDIFKEQTREDLKKKGNSYHLNWRTSSAWEGTCRRLTLRIPAAADAVAYFSFH